MTQLVWCDRLVGADGDGAGWVEIDGERVAGVGHGAAPPNAQRLDGCSIVPGFVDIHVHGGGGHTMTTGDPDAVVHAARFHRTHGTTAMMASFVTAPLDELAAASRRLAALFDDPPDDLRRQFLGIHLEGPFLATGRCGAQNPEHMVDPTPEAVAALIAAGGGHLRMVTIAPERPGSLDAVRQFVAAGVTVAIGHTDCTWADAVAAIEAGATVATHLGNAMPPVHHRQPGPFGACLGSAAVTCELIVDGHHLHPATVRLAHLTKGAGGIALITDAISAAGAEDGRYRLGDLDVDVAGGVARLAHGDSLAGSTLTMDAALRNAVAAGLPLTDASAAASTNPAGVIGHRDGGRIAPGSPADLVVLEADHTVRAVVAAGQVVSGSL